MRLFRHRPAKIGNVGSRDAERNRIDFAWRVHSAQESWANKTDVKASIVLALEGGGLFAVISAHANGGVLTRLESWHRPVQNAGVILLLTAMVAAVVAVYPKIRVPRVLEQAPHYRTIYFGHVRQWGAKELTGQLRSLTSDEELEAISQQLVAISRSNWNKLRWIQVSLVLAMLGILLIAVAVVSTLE